MVSSNYSYLIIIICLQLYALANLFDPLMGPTPSQNGPESNCSDLESHHQMLFSVISKTPFFLEGLKPLQGIQSVYSLTYQQGIYNSR